MCDLSLALAGRLSGNVEPARSRKRGGGVRHPGGLPVGVIASVKVEARSAAARGRAAPPQLSVAAAVVDRARHGDLRHRAAGPVG
jgi:hypothetical protein